METAYLNAIANHGGSVLTHVGLKNASGTELAGGTPAYARQAVAWTQAVDGVIKPTTNLTFAVPAGANVASWFVTNSAGTTLGSGTLTQENYTNQGEYVLVAATSSISHSSN